MWPSIKRWRDWAMRDFWFTHRTGPQPQALHYSYEKAGLTLSDQPVPWNAEVVLVEAILRLQKGVPRRKADFQLDLPGHEPVPAESLRRHEKNENYHLFFRLPPPPRTAVAEVRWRGHALGQLTIPVLDQESFLRDLRLDLLTLFVRLGEQNVACHTFVSTQCRGLMATAVVSSPTSLVPLLDLGLHVEFRSERGGHTHEVPARLCSSQLAERQALVAVVPRGFPRRIGTWTATWKLADRALATQRVRAISQRAFQRSLRVSDTRFVIQKGKGPVCLARQLPPMEELSRAGPCFLVSSRETGMAGLCPFQVRAQVPGGFTPPVLQEQEVLITDGPAMVAPGTLDAADLALVGAFELRLKGETLGVLSLSPVPTAGFTAEGGYKAPAEFTWSGAADEELNERLARLMEGRTSPD